VRLIFSKMKFRLDAADERLIAILPTFDTIIELVQYYRNSKRNTVWIDTLSGLMHSVVVLGGPLRSSLSLKHLCRIKVNGMDCSEKLPVCLQSYLGEYPFLL